jgi:hypothetical protein
MKYVNVEASSKIFQELALEFDKNNFKSKE